MNHLEDQKQAELMEGEPMLGWGTVGKEEGTRFQLEWICFNDLLHSLVTIVNVIYTSTLLKEFILNLLTTKE